MYTNATQYTMLYTIYTDSCVQFCVHKLYTVQVCFRTLQKFHFIPIPLHLACKPDVITTLQSLVTRKWLKNHFIGNLVLYKTVLKPHYGVISSESHGPILQQARCNASKSVHNCRHNKNMYTTVYTFVYCVHMPVYIFCLHCVPTAKHYLHLYQALGIEKWQILESK